MMFNSKFVSSMAIAAIAGFVAADDAQAQHVDVNLHADHGRIVVSGGAHDHDDHDEHDDHDDHGTPVHVFGYDFGSDYFLGDPGFNAASGSGLPAGSLKLNVLSSLVFWDGTGSVNFGAPLGEALRFSNGPTQLDIDGTTLPASPFTIGTVGSNGGVHAHIGSWLLDANGNAYPNQTAVPAEGIYALSVELRITNGSDTDLIGRSDPVWFVYNNGLSEALHELAIDYVVDSYVPEPGALSLLAIGGMAMLRRRRVQM